MFDPKMDVVEGGQQSNKGRLMNNASTAVKNETSGNAMGDDFDGQNSEKERVMM